MGLKKTIKFFWTTVDEEDWNNLPSNGIEPKIGTFETVSCVSSSIKPPRTIIWPLSTSTVVSITLLFVIKSMPLVMTPATPDTSCLILSITELPSFICGVTSSLIPTSCLDVVLNGLALLVPRLSPVVIGISWPITRFAVSLSIAKIDGVDKIFELVSWAIALIIPMNLSPPSERSPNPVTSPCVFRREDKAEVFKFTSWSLLAAPTIDRRSGPAPPNLVIPIGILSLSVPL